MPRSKQTDRVHQPGNLAVTLERLRKRILGGGRPALEDLVGEDMAAANEMISRGEAEVVCTGCHLYLTATLRDASAPDYAGNLRAAISRILEKR